MQNDFRKSKGYNLNDTEYIIESILNDGMELGFACPAPQMPSGPPIPPGPPLFQQHGPENRCPEFEYINSISQEIKQNLDNLIAKVQNISEDSTFLTTEDIIIALIEANNRISSMEEQINTMNDISNNQGSELLINNLI